jgi:uncharacterized protein (TIGR02594 family)
VKKLIFIAFLSGCSYAEALDPSNDPVLSAMQNLGMNERTHRQELKELTGVDPVRTEWCAAFVNGILDLNGIKGSASVSDYPLTARSFLLWGVPVQIPQKGDIVVFPRGNQGWQGHVGFYVTSHYINNVEYYVILGGNQNDSVSYELYAASLAISIRRNESAF